MLYTMLIDGAAADVLCTIETSLILSEESRALLPDQSTVFSLDQMEKLQTATYGGLTLLGWAVKLGNLAVLERLLRDGLSGYLPVDVHGNTPLHMSALCNNPEAIDLLVSTQNVDLEQKNNKGFTAAMLCAKFEKFAALMRLEANGASIITALKGRYAGWILALILRQRKLVHKEIKQVEVEYFKFLRSIL